MNRVEHPLIAINGEMVPGKTAARLSLNNLYADAVLRAGGVPIAIPPVGGPWDIARLLANVDGLVLGGGTPSRRTYPPRRGSAKIPPRPERIPRSTQRRST